MRTVTVVIQRIVIIIVIIPASNVINITIAIIIDSVVRNLTFINPNILKEITMIIVNTRINNGNRNTLALGKIPGIFAVDSIGLERPEVIIGLAPASRRIVIRIIGY